MRLLHGADGELLMRAPIFQFFAGDHRRLDALLERSVADSAVDRPSFDAFRAGILKHIAMEEKRLIPEATAARGGRTMPIAAKLRVDHGAIAALLVPTPTPRIVALLVGLLDRHNAREEEPGGLYQTCDGALGETAAARLVDSLRSFPDVRLKPYNDGPAVEKHIEETLALSRAQWEQS